MVRAIAISTVPICYPPLHHEVLPRKGALSKVFFFDPQDSMMWFCRSLQFQVRTEGDVLCVDPNVFFASRHLMLSNLQGVAF